MAIRRITIFGTGLIGGSLGLALKSRGFHGQIVGCDRPPVLEKARRKGAIDEGISEPSGAVRGSQVVVLATPIAAVIDLIERIGPILPARTLLTDVGSTKTQIVARAAAVLGKNANRFLGGHPMAGKEQSGVEFADEDLFESAVWFITPMARQKLDETGQEYLEWVQRIGAHTAFLNAAQHDRVCAWTSHLPQMISTALAASLVDEFGEGAPVLELGGRALREMTRVSASPYSMWRDVALTNKKNISGVLLKLEQRLAYLRENLDTRELAMEFEKAHQLYKLPLTKPGARAKGKG